MDATSYALQTQTKNNPNGNSASDGSGPPAGQCALQHHAGAWQNVNCIDLSCKFPLPNMLKQLWEQVWLTEATPCNPRDSCIHHPRPGFRNHGSPPEAQSPCLSGSRPTPIHGEASWTRSVLVHQTEPRSGSGNFEGQHNKLNTLSHSSGRSWEVSVVCARHTVLLEGGTLFRGICVQWCLMNECQDLVFPSRTLYCKKTKKGQCYSVNMIANQCIHEHKGMLGLQKSLKAFDSLSVISST